MVWLKILKSGSFSTENKSLNKQTNKQDQMVSRASTQSQRAKVDGGMLVSAGQLELGYVLVVLKKNMNYF